VAAPQAAAGVTLVLQSVATDASHQSQSAVLLGEPGCGKTHPVMRLAHIDPGV
jgi:hypothetical protein